jgi:hypothetical protein
MRYAGEKARYGWGRAGGRDTGGHLNDHVEGELVG